MQSKTRRRRVRHGLDYQLPPEDSEEHHNFELNSQISPLLRLPPELRLRIYELVLVVGQISVDFKPWIRRVGTGADGRLQENNTANNNSKELLKGGFYCRTLGASQNPWGRHGWGSSSDDSRQVGTSAGSGVGGVTLLSAVCRQLYHETVLMPYKLNTWSFREPHVMTRYLDERRLPLRQRRAIHTLYVRASTLPKVVYKSFGGLKVVIWYDGKSLRRQTLGDEDSSRMQQR